MEKTQKYWKGMHKNMQKILKIKQIKTTKNILIRYDPREYKWKAPQFTKMCTDSGGENQLSAILENGNLQN